MKLGPTTDISNHQLRLRDDIVNRFARGRGLEIGPNMASVRTRDFITLDVRDRRDISVRADVQSLPFRDDAFDTVAALEILEHVRYPHKMLREVWRVTKPGGSAYLSTPNVATFTNRIALSIFGVFPDDRTLHDGSDVGHLHYFTRTYFLEALRSVGFAIRREWTHLLPVTPRWYLYGTVLERVFPNFAKQVVVECTPIKA